MTMHARQNTASRPGRLIRPSLRARLPIRAMPAVTVLLLAFFALCVPSIGWALGSRGSARMFGQRGGGHYGGQQSHPAPPPQARPSPSHVQAPEPSRAPEPRPNPPSYSSNTQPSHPGQQHLPEWLNSHQNMSPQQREDALRREPGFRNLPEDQQQRLVNRLHSLDEKSPEQRQRILQRNENFEHLSPERRQEVRGASQALGQMSPDRQVAVRHAFQQLRQMPPGERQQMLNSQGYASHFSPQERTVLGNLLSIEPYQRPGAIPQPYFGRP